ncbi:MAG TPA: DinB family protein [Pyrinomonadaceae bacterium]|nr:DinB family protein [Pyrinomonadaceae bacterium]
MTANAPAAARPSADEYAPFYETYVSLVPEGDVVGTLTQQLEETLALLRNVPAAREDFSYEPGKWSIKEIVGHMTDAERIFSYRALCIARGDKANLPGMNQEEYMQGANFNTRRLADLAAEFEYVRRATLSLFRHLDEEAWLRRGTANDSEVSVRALAHILAGHEAHHVRVLRERYL